jgi:hypothetical protein
MTVMLARALQRSERLGAVHWRPGPSLGHSAAVTLRIALSLLSVTVACFGAVSQHPARHFEGTAYAGAKAVFKEEHFRFADASGVTTELVLYRCPSDEPFARKWVRDVANNEAPDFELVDARTGYREGVRTIDGRREAFVQTDRESVLRTVVLPVRPDSVIDAGFDAFVSNRWDELDSTGHISFVVPSRLGYLDMRIKSTDFETLAGEPVRHVRLGLDTWYSFVAPTIDLHYASSDHSVRRFEGPSNILDASGRRQAVRVEFPGTTVFPTPTQQEIDHAAALSLANHCPP